MLVVVSELCLDAVVKRRVPDNTMRVLNVSKLVATRGLMRRYEEVVPDADLFRTWLAAEQARDGVGLLMPDGMYQYPRDVGEIDPEHLVAAHQSGLLVYVGDGHHVRFQEEAREFGVELVDDPGMFRMLRGGVSGRGICFDRAYRGGEVVDLGVLRRFFSMERKVVILDKYFNAEGMALVEELLRDVDTIQTVKVLTDDRVGVLDTREVRAQLERRFPRVRVSARGLGRNARKQWHDRFVWCGKRFQMRFTRGLDGIVWDGGQWCAQEGRVTVTSLLDRGETVSIECDRGGREVVTWAGNGG